MSRWTTTEVATLAREVPRAAVPVSRPAVVAVLFARADSIYKQIADVDVWDEMRDARNWPGGVPVVAHPPCKRWSSLNNLVLARYPHRASDFAHGNDGGLFELALRAVRTYGGVLEHPAYSRAWRIFDLPRPHPGNWQRGICGGWAIEVDQAAWGHPARKRTWLYAFGLAPPGVPFSSVEHASDAKVVRVYRRRLADGTWARTEKSERNREITHKAAEMTPRPFAEWLLGIARSCPVPLGEVIL